ENGQISVNHKKFLGYTKDEDGNLVIVPEEAKIVRRIYREYLEGKSTLQIKRGLESDGIKTVTGLDKWHVGTLDKMLSNRRFIIGITPKKLVTTRLSKGMLIFIPQLK
ncbi:MAG: recombinase family protein, partial [Anaerotignaceae bacterium]